MGMSLHQLSANCLMDLWALTSDLLYCWPMDSMGTGIINQWDRFEKSTVHIYVFVVFFLLKTVIFSVRIWSPKGNPVCRLSSLHGLFKSVQNNSPCRVSINLIPNISAYTSHWRQLEPGTEMCLEGLFRASVRSLAQEKWADGDVRGT